MATTQMSVQDALWLTMDRPNNLMVVDGTMVMSAPIELDEVKAIMLRTADHYPVFRRKPQRRGNSWVWVDDPSFDIDDHVTLADIEGSVDMVGLQRFMGEKRSKPLDKRHPLWHIYVIPELVLDDGTLGSAVVDRFHHAIADGVRLTQLMLSLCEAESGTVVPRVARDGTGDGPFSAVAAVRSTAVETVRVTTSATRSAGAAAAGVVVDLAGAASDLARQTVGAVADPVGTVKAAPGAIVSAPGRVIAATKGLTRSGVHGLVEGADLVRHPDRLVDALEVLGVEDHRVLNDMTSVTKLVLTDSPEAVWSGKPGRRKAMAWSRPIPLDDVRKISRSHKVTLNDVMVAAVSGGLRRYLADRDDQVDEVVWMVPVNLKPFAENLPSELGNYFALIFLPMPLVGSTHHRLSELHQRMKRIKHSDEAVLTFGLQRGVSMSPSRMAFFLTNFFANKAVGVLSNVPGPTGLLTFAGAPVLQVVGFAPCSGNQPMTCTIFSYNGAVTVGFATDAGLVAEPAVLVDFVVEEVTQMRAAVGRRARAAAEKAAKEAAKEAAADTAEAAAAPA